VNRAISYARIQALLVKEFIQMRRDRLTFAMIVGVPIMQLFLFGYAINADPRHLPTVVTVSDPGPLSDSVVAALENSTYFDVVKATQSPDEAHRMLDEGTTSFVVAIPVNFSRDIARGANPELLVEADATDPATSSNAIGAFTELANDALRDDLKGPLAVRAQSQPAFTVVIHRLYNPEVNTHYNIVPGLLGVILTMTMVLMTSLAVTRERERGTYENLLAMPTHPLEIMIGKIVPNIFVGLIQSTLVLVVANWIFGVPIIGSIVLLYSAVALFIAANLAVGYTFSTIAQNQLQAMQMVLFFLLPSILLSGFAFPFRGMPDWAQWVGEFLPNTHFLRVVRGVMLKGNGLDAAWPDIWPLILFLFAVGIVSLLRFRRTLD
jgi:ABC-2 type transport system permease protein